MVRLGELLEEYITRDLLREHIVPNAGMPIA